MSRRSKATVLPLYLKPAHNSRIYTVCFNAICLTGCFFLLATATEFCFVVVGLGFFFGGFVCLFVFPEESPCIWERKLINTT